ncbi:hypothetical protein V9T40_005891 [Parthenolecanium corni]|uniref:Uncharacterized protein n=1 Tax=Parthenolecanium corni TaxID=536013 RepID=A0AAN9TXD6_9HEMI
MFFGVYGVGQFDTHLAVQQCRSPLSYFAEHTPLFVGQHAKCTQKPHRNSRPATKAAANQKPGRMHLYMVVEGTILA